MEEDQRKQLYKLIGEKIDRYRKIMKLTQSEICDKLDINRATLSNIIAGRQQVSIHLLMDIAMELKVDPTSLLPTVEELAGNTTNNDVFEKILLSNKISDSDRMKILDTITRPIKKDTK